MRDYALLVARCVVVPCEFLVQPDASVAVVCVAVSAQWRVVELQQLLVGDAKPVVEVADGT